jgi:hypothetical protein
MKPEHVCTTGKGGCLGYTRAHGRRFYYCKKQKPVTALAHTKKP